MIFHRATGRFHFHFSGLGMLLKLKGKMDYLIKIGDIVNFHPEKIQTKPEKNISATSSNNSERTKANHQSESPPKELKRMEMELVSRL